jgi:hypothetical protein
MQEDKLERWHHYRGEKHRLRWNWSLIGFFFIIAVWAILIVANPARFFPDALIFAVFIGVLQFAFYLFYLNRLKKRYFGSRRW